MILELKFLSPSSHPQIGGGHEQHKTERKEMRSNRIILGEEEEIIWIMITTMKH